MKDYFETELKRIDGCSNEYEKRLRIVTALRLFLQQVVYGMLEWVGGRFPDPAIAPQKNIIDSLWKPSDGSLVDALDSLLIAATATGWSGCSRILIKRVGDDAAAEICGEHPKNLLGVLRALVELRNNGAEGHGLAGGYRPDIEMAALRFVMNSLWAVLPYFDDAGLLVVGEDESARRISFIKTLEGRPLLIRGLRRISADKVRVECQYYADGGGLGEYRYDASNPFSDYSKSVLPSLVVWCNEWSPHVYFPDRKTDSFTGRAGQIEELYEWYGDEGSRACLIYGDGGFGKTTLAIEFIHRVLDQEINSNWRPKVVIFYTAKRTQWGLNGLEVIKSGQPHLIEFLVLINLLIFEEQPEASFYRMDFLSAVSNIQGRIINEKGLRKSDFLFIIDNTETLISDDAEGRAVGKELREIVRKLGRVIVTSRRKEYFEASPIEVPILEMDEAISYVKDRSALLGCSLGISARESELRTEIDKIERRPIVLEAFVNALCDPAVRTIARATERVSKMLNKDLGEFLFADAWSRFDLKEKRVLLLMAQIADVHQSHSFRICCDEAGVSVSSMENVLNQSGGIASVVTVGGDIQVNFSRNFVDFAKSKQVALPNGDKSPTDEELRSVTGKISIFIKSASRFRGHGAGHAYRTQLAKAAEVQRRNGDIDASRRLYEQAIASDAMNGGLRERFAYFLFSSLQDYDGALHQAKKAVEFSPSDKDAWFMRGLVEARMGDFRACELSLSKAEEYGLEWYRCSVQRCWGYLKSNPPQIPLANKEILRLNTYLSSHGADSRIGNEVGLLKKRLEVVKFRGIKIRGR